MAACPYTFVGPATRSGLKIIRGRADSYFRAVQGARSVVDRVSMSDEERRNARKQMSALWVAPKNRVCCVAALEHRTTMLCAPRLADALFGHNATPNNIETASNNRAAPVLESHYPEAIIRSVLELALADLDRRLR